VPLLAINEKESVQKWSISGSNLKRAYDKTVKGYVYITDQNTKLMMPGLTRQVDLYLLQTNLLFQIKILDKKSFNLEVMFTDTEGVKRRIHFNGSGDFIYSKENIIKGPNNVRVPSSMLLEGVWLNLQFDIQSFIQNTFEPTFKFRSIDGIVLGGACLVRRISTSK
jgi:hypothetical protein